MIKKMVCILLPLKYFKLGIEYHYQVDLEMKNSDI